MHCAHHFSDRYVASGSMASVAPPCAARAQRQFAHSLKSETPAKSRLWRYREPLGDVVCCTSKYAHLSSVGGPAKTFGRSDTENTPVVGNFRFWHDERRFKGSGENSIVQQALYEVGGVRTGGYPKTAPVAGVLGAERVTDWDMLWSPSRAAIKAAAQMKPGQLICAVPGMSSITRKGKLVSTLKDALGPAASIVIPESYVLPNERSRWGELVKQDPERLWMLKTGQHLGKGLKLLPGEEAMVESAKSRAGKKPYLVAQHYVNNPLLIDGCKFGIRVWVVVTGIDPFRAYIHTNGLVLFSTDQYDDSEWETEEGQVSEGHITNYAQNVNGRVWNMKMLQEHLGKAAHQTLWNQIVRNSALTFASSVGTVRKEEAELKMPPNTTFEVLGLDFLVDEQLKPWLLEVNGTPSLAVEHADPDVEQLIFEQKMGMVRDMVQLLGIPDRFSGRYMKRGGALSKAEQATRQLRLAGLGPDGSPFMPVLEELKRRGSFLPLMPLFPAVQPDGPIPWSANDIKLHQMLLRSAAAAAGGQAPPQRRQQPVAV